MRYFVYKDSRILGPLDKDELGQAGGLRAETLLCEEGVSGRSDSDWRSAESIPELAGLLSSAGAAVALASEPWESGDSAVLERLELESLGVPGGEESAESWVEQLFDDAEFKQRWSGLLPRPEGGEQDRIRELTAEIEALRARLAALGSAPAPAPASAPAAAAPPPPAPAQQEEPSAPPPPPEAPKPGLKFGAAKSFHKTAEEPPAPVPEPPKPAGGLKFGHAKALPKAAEPPAPAEAPAETPPGTPPPRTGLKFTVAKKLARPGEGPAPGTPQGPGTEPPRTPMRFGSGALRVAKREAPAAAEPASAPAPTPVPEPAKMVLQPPPPLEAPALPTPQPAFEAAPPTLAPTPAPAAPPTFAAPAPVTMEAASFPALVTGPAPEAPPATMAFAGPALGTPPLGEALTPSRANVEASTGPGPATQEVIARLAKPAQPGSEAKARKKSPPYFIIASAGLLAALVVVFFLFFRNSRDIKMMVNMGTDQKPLGAETPEESQAKLGAFKPVPGAPPLNPAPNPPPAGAALPTAPAPVAPAPAPAPVAPPPSEGDAAIALVKGYPLEGDRGTVGQWLQYSFTANPADGNKEEWTAGAVEASAFLVQYRVLPGPNSALKEPITYLFEADTTRRTVKGSNPPARELMGGSLVPKAKPRRAAAPRRRPKRRPAAAPAKPKEVPLLPLPSDDDLLPPADDDAEFRKDTVRKGF